MAQYYIGLMSGTSIDGVDAALIEVVKTNKAPNKVGSTETSGLELKTIASCTLDWPLELKNKVQALCQEHSSHDNVHDAFLTANELAQSYANIVKKLLAKANLSAKDIVAIGSHGQTVRHHPQEHFSVQLDNGPLIANLTKIDTVVNFRAADLACGGQGAPIAQAFHQQVLCSPKVNRMIVNLGGITNVSLINTKGELLTAFDTGPANTLLDLVCRDYLNIAFDTKGQHARHGKIDQDALNILLKHPYLAKAYPKSTGREEFNYQTIEFYLQDKLHEFILDQSNDFNRLSIKPWLKDLIFSETQAIQTSFEQTASSPQKNQCLFSTKTKLSQRKHQELDAFVQAINDILATLTEFTSVSLVNTLVQLKQDFNAELAPHSEIILCGGGALNPFLQERISKLAQPHNITTYTSADFNIDPKFIEASAFAYFAYAMVNGIAIDLCSSTGAKTSSIFGCLCPYKNGHYVNQQQLLHKIQKQS